MHDRYTIQTPENVTFEFELAGLGSRGLAWAIDIVVIGVALFTSAWLIIPLVPVLGGVALGLFSIASFLAMWWYAALCEWLSGGRTVGKKLLRLRTLGDHGVRITFVQAVVRNLLRIIDLLPGIYLVGGVSALLDPNARRLGDIAAGTIVVRERRAVRPTALVRTSERYNSFLRDPRVLGAARRVSAQERDAMVSLGLRREELPLALRYELFARLSAHLETRLGIPRPPFFSEEKFVLHLTAVLLGDSEVRK